jgi:hypothetical protein
MQHIRAATLNIEHCKSADSGVRRGKAALSGGCKSHPASAPAGSSRSSHGGNEVAEGRNASERRANLEKNNAQADPYFPGPQNRFVVGLDCSRSGLPQEQAGPVVTRFGFVGLDRPDRGLYTHRLK